MVAWQTTVLKSHCFMLCDCFLAQCSARGFEAEGKKERVNDLARSCHSKAQDQQFSKLNRKKKGHWDVQGATVLIILKGPSYKYMHLSVLGSDVLVVVLQIKSHMYLHTAVYYYSITKCFLSSSSWNWSFREQTIYKREYCPILLWNTNELLHGNQHCHKSIKLKATDLQALTSVTTQNRFMETAIL